MKAILTIIKPLVISDADDACGSCAVQAERLCDALREAGYNAVIAQGHFHPRAPKETWAERIRKQLEGETYHHFWVKVNGVILDPTASQFGESEVCFAEDDCRYECHDYEHGGPRE